MAGDQINQYPTFDVLSHYRLGSTGRAIMHGGRSSDGDSYEIEGISGCQERGSRRVVDWHFVVVFRFHYDRRRVVHDVGINNMEWRTGGPSHVHTQRFLDAASLSAGRRASL